MNDKRIKLLTIGVIASIVINLGLVSFLIINKRMHGHDNHRMHRGARFLVKELALDENQRKDFIRAFKMHHESKRAMETDIHRKKTALIKAVMEGSQEKEQEILNDLAQLHQQNEEEWLKHLQQLKNICSDDQLDVLIKTLKKMPPRSKKRH